MSQQPDLGRRPRFPLNRSSAGPLQRSFLLFWAALLLMLWAPLVQAQPAQGPGGPVLVVTSGNSNFGTYYAEILRNEGLNAFAVDDIANITPARLASFDLVVLAKMPLSSAQVTVFSDWVNAGGNLIAMAPDAQLATLLGLSPTGATLAEAYLKVDTSTIAGNGIHGQTMQFHGTADRWSLNGATALAMLYSNATTPTSSPAVTLRSVGAGKAAAFTYDLATSIVYTRQGNPAWATQERDGFAPIRSNDKFFGNAANDPQADWIDLNKVAVPQADEQQRLLANLILQMNLAKKPLPRFWYFPHGKKAVVVMTGDDHANGGTAPRFDQFIAASPSVCSVADWECIRGTSYIYTNTPLTDAQAAAYDAAGFEVGIHISTSCADYTAESLQQNYVQQLADWRAKYLSLAAPTTQRHHCIAWSDWTTGAQVQLANGMRLDTSYYFWPPSWVRNTPGLFNGTAMPMRFAGLDGSLIDVYQATTQMTDESGQAYPYTVDTLLDRALGAEGYYGAYTVNAHTDYATIVESTTVVASAQARGVPVVSSRQMLNWLDARNASSFAQMAWNGSSLSFTLNAASGANGLRAMLPLRAGGTLLSGLTRGGTPVSFTVETIKGVEYAFFAAASGSHVATYVADTTAPTVTGSTPAAGATAVAVGSAVSVAFSEALDPATVNANTVLLQTSSGASVAASVTYNAATRSAVLTPASVMEADTAYTVRVRGGASDPRIKDPAGNALAADAAFSFTTGSAGSGSNCPCGGWTSDAVPAIASVNDPNPVELGVKFTVDTDGYVSGIRFYKGPSNTGTHVGNLWTASGQLLATATFSAETATGWQQVDFAAPVAVSANTVYVASYFAPNGSYAADSFYFQSAGVDRAPVHLLREGVSGSNGVYAYGSASVFPTSSYQSTNYWVDVAFTATPVVDTTPPTVSTVLPVAGATSVATSAVVSAVFSEPMAAATFSTASFELRTAAGDLVAATVTYDSASRTATLSPSSALSAQTSYTATLRGGTADPRVKDVAGNALGASVSWSFTTGATGGSNCAAPANAIVAENCLPGDPASSWDISGVGDATIQGFATSISVNRGSTISFKVNTPASNYRFDIYRMGYYGGQGARKVATVLPSASLPQTQPACLNDTSTGLIDCGNWGVSGSWAVPADAVSGIYFAKLVRTDTGGASHIVFVVRDDASTSDLVFQTSDTTWQAYNSWGGNSLYTGSPDGRAYKVSYNRPFNTRVVDGGQDWVFNSEYPAVRWLEANGYHVSYQSGVDTDRFGSLLRNHKAFLSVGHDEYWSGAQRANVEAARDAGVNLVFLSGNEIFWKTRWENSIDGSGTAYRTLVSYKETQANAKIDPTATWTGTWRDPRFSPPADGGRPENALTGTIFAVNSGTTSITVPEAEGKLRLWRNTSVANLAAGTVATLPNGTLGYEWDVDADNGSRPPGLVRLSNTTASGVQVLLDQGSTYGNGTANHALTFYKHSSGARVFSAGTIQWSWGLDEVHDRAGTPSDLRMKQATVNLLADMGVQPATLQAGLVAASASTDTTAPVSSITDPLASATVQQGVAYTVRGTASDSGGGLVGGVEVSTDGGATWRAATGRASWSYTWVPAATGSVTLRSRAVDDSGNIEAPSAGVAVAVQPRTCPCSIWSSGATPTVANTADSAAVNLGVRFTADQDGFISGIRFYKGTANTGTHIGSLWSATGTLLASATFTNETASGWQQVSFAQPVAVTAGTVYVASYFAPNGNYASDLGYFATTGVDSPPLHALNGSTNGPNGVYAYGSGNAFPASTYQATNYWVDVVFTLPVANRSPLVANPGGQTSTQGVALTLAISASDPDGDTLAYSATGLPTGLVISATTGAITGTPSAAGSFTPTVTVSDGKGGSASAGFSWTVSAPPNRPPVLTTPSAQTTVRGTAVSLTVSATDPDSNPLTFSASGLPTGLSISTSGVITGTPTVAGTWNPTVTVQDGRGGSASGSFAWTIRDPATNVALAKAATQSSTAFSGVATRAVDGRTDGVYNNGSVSHTDITAAQPWWQVDLGALYAIDNIVLWNRTDCCADRLQNFYVFISASNMTGRTLDQLRADPAVITRQVGSGIISPSLNLALSGGIGRYVRVQLSATQYLSLAEVQVLGVLAPNRPPVVTTPAAQTATQGTATSLAISARDPDLNTLSYSATGLPTGLSISSTTGLISGTPTATGTFNPLVTVNDGKGATATATFSWTVNPPPNRPPVLTTPSAQTTVRGTAVSLTVTATDPDSNPLSFSASGLPTGLSISSTGVITGTPTVSGIYTPTVTVNDGKGGSASGSFSWTVKEPNRAPSLTTPATQSTPLSSSASLTLSASDPDADKLTFSASGLPTGLSINTTTGVISGIATALGAYTPSVTARDPAGLTATASFSWIVQPPATAVACANEGGTCVPPIAAIVTIYYGASGKYVVRTGMSGSTACTNATFGDPNVGVAKSCSYVVTGSLASNTGKGLQGQYFATNDLSGSVVLQRTEAVNFNWGSGSPGTPVPSDNFSVRWSGLIEAPSTGNYTFQTNSDDGIRVWVNGALIINNWTAHSATLNTSGTVSLTANRRYTITVEYQEFTGSALAQLSWRVPFSLFYVSVPSTRLYGP